MPESKKTQSQTPNKTAANSGAKTPPKTPKAKKPEGPIFIKLRVFAGMMNGAGGMIPRLTYDESGNVQNANQIVSLQFDSMEWHNYLKQLPGSEWVKVVIESAFQGDQKIEPPKEAVKQVEEALEGPEGKQDEIAQLKAQIEASNALLKKLEGGNK